MFDIKVAFVLLAGGKSKRFGGKIHKGLLNIDGIPIIKRQLDTLIYFMNPIYLVTRDHSQVKEYKKVLSDKYPVHYVVDDTSIFKNKIIRTPLIGMYSGFLELKKTNIEYGFVISCDMPFIKKEVMSLIIQNSEHFDATVPRWQNGYLEPLFATYNSQSVVQCIFDNITIKQYRLSSLIENCSKVNYIGIEELIKPIDKELKTFINVNKPKDLLSLS